MSDASACVPDPRGVCRNYDDGHRVTVHARETRHLPGTRPDFRQAIPTNFWAVGDHGFTYECTNGCGFWKNVDLGPCRLIGCGGTIVEQRWVRVDD